MLLTVEQLYEIRRIIEKYHDAFVVNAISPDAVAPEILERLQEEGLVDVEVSSIQDAYIYGQLLGIMQDKKTANMSYEEFRKYVRKNPVPLTTPEKQAVVFAQMNAAQYTKGLGNRVNMRTGAVLIEADQKQRVWLEAEIRSATETNIQQRQTVQQLKTDLGWIAKDWARDWGRIAVTEKQNAMQHGLADNYRKRFSGEALVAKRIMPDACPHCRKAYLENDQPRIFKLSTLEANGTNVGRKASDWLPVVGVMHPNCFEKQTLITTDCGDIPIESVVPGNRVLSHDSKWHVVKALLRSEFNGNLARIKGKDWGLGCTSNHPFRVRNSWIQAKSLKKGTHLIQKVSGQDNLFTDDCTQNKPIFADKESGFLRVIYGVLGSGMPVTAIDFNGNLFIRKGQVDIVNENSELGYQGKPPFLDLCENEFFTGRIEITLSALSYFGAMFLRVGATPDGFVCGASIVLPFFRGHFRGSDCLSCALIPGPVSSFSNAIVNSMSTDAQLFTYSLYREQVVKVEFDAHLGGDIVSSSCSRISRSMDHVLPSFGFSESSHSQSCPFSSGSIEVKGSEVESDGGCTDFQDDGYFIGELFLIEKFGKLGFVNSDFTHKDSLDVNCQCTPITDYQLEEFKGIVYNLSVAGTESYFANGILVHNCQCQLINVPEGWGFDKDGDLVPGAEGGYVHDDEGELVLALREEAELQKAFQLQGHIVFQGIPIAIENRKNTTRTWKDGDGNTGKTKLTYAYGYVKKTNGVDEDEIDCFIGPDPKAANVFIVEQQNKAQGTYDEQKVMIGFPNQGEAEKAYRENFDVPDDFFITIEPMSVEAFKRYIAATQPKKGEMLKSDDPDHELFVIPLGKSLDPNLGAISSPAGDRHPSGIQGSDGVNFVIPFPKKDNPREATDDDETGANPKSIKEAGKREDFESGGLWRNKEIYNFQKPLRNVHPVVLPDNWDAKYAREDVKKVRKEMVDRYKKNVGRPKNIILGDD